jgi:hypothetical protein
MDTHSRVFVGEWLNHRVQVRYSFTFSVWNEALIVSWGGMV